MGFGLLDRLILSILSIDVRIFRLPKGLSMPLSGASYLWGVCFCFRKRRNPQAARATHAITEDSLMRVSRWVDEKTPSDHLSPWKTCTWDWKRVLERGHMSITPRP